MADLLIAANSVPLSGADLKPSSGTPQYATSGNPAASIPATVWPAYMANMIISELRNVVLAGYMTPSGDDWAQIWQASLRNATAYDTGAVNAISCALPPITSAVDPAFTLGTGVVLWVYVAHTNTSTFVTLDAFGSGAKTVLRPDGSTPAPGDFPANTFIPFVYDSASWRAQPIVEPPVFPVTVPQGGTARDTLAAGSVLIGNGVSQVGLAAPGTAGYALLSNGAGVAPSFQQITPDIIGGVLPVPKGGTGEATFTTGALLAGNGTSPLFEIAPPSGAYPLLSNGPGSLPNYGAINLAGVGVSGVLPIARAPVQLWLVTAIVGVSSFVVPAGHTALYFEIIGGGGGGAGENTGGPFTGGGGGAGGYCAFWVAVTPGETILITVGAGGTAGPGTSDGSGNGGNGGSSGVSGSFGGVTVVGGNGGQSGVNAAGGEGGFAMLGGLDGLTVNGGHGTDGDISGGESYGGNGGAGFFGGGIRGSRGSPPSGTAAPGAGGGGGYFGMASGSIGMPGMVIIRG